MRIDRMVHDLDRIELWVAPRGDHAECPSCGGASARGHSRYLRQLHDLAVGGRQVLIHLRVRRYFCDVADCGVRHPVAPLAHWDE